MKQILNVKIDKTKEYPIEISNESIENLRDKLFEFTKNQKRLFVISKKVYKLYANQLNLPKDEVFILKDGECEKNINNYQKILKQAISIGLTRKDVIIAIGGGVVGDIAGFVAATYMRGIDFIQVPTTLLAAVDSSVGGKTAIDLDCGKNIIGAFYQPKAVYININFINTLDNRQFMSGMAEVIKYSFIENNCGYESPLYLFELLTLAKDKIIDREPVSIAKIIEYCLKLKIAVVTQDEKENGLRKVLNFGHTYGHVLETITKYKKYTHGEAIIFGMYFIIDWAYKNEFITYTNYKVSIELLEKYGYKRLNKKYSPELIVDIIKKDKKATSNEILFIVPCEKKTVKEVKIPVIEIYKMVR